MSAMFTVKFRDRMKDGLLPLRDIGDDGEIVDLPILKEYRSAKALLRRIEAEAQAFVKDQPVVLAKAWIETLPGLYGTPWEMHTSEYDNGHVRTRTCLIPVPLAFTCSGQAKVRLDVGVVNVVEHRILHCEVNYSEFPRTHLIVDVRRPDGE